MPGAAQVKQFVDGKLEGAGAFSWRERPLAQSAGEAGKLTLGRTTVTSSAADGFVGALDELFIADRPLTPFELRQLIEKNELPGGT